VEVIEEVEPFAEVVDPLLRLPSPKVEFEFVVEFFLRITFLGFFSNLSEEPVGVTEGIARDIVDPIEKAA
jgi:hypothetical protein